MSNLMIVSPLPVAAVAGSRGSGAERLAAGDPREAWIDTPPGGAVTFTVDLGAVRSIDTIFLGYLERAGASATWSIAAGVDSGALLPVQPASALRVPDVPGHAAARSHALWTGSAVSARFLRLVVDGPADATPLSIGVLVVGRAFVPALGREWGFGRRVVDTGVATPLPSGGFAAVEGVRKRAVSWSFGDLSAAEVDQLELVALEVGSSRPALVIEDAAATPGLHARLHYGLFDRWRAFERRNQRQTRWEIGLEQWS